MTPSEFLVKLLKEKGLNTKQLSDELGVSDSYITKVKYGVILLPWKLANALISKYKINIMPMLIEIEKKQLEQEEIDIKKRIAHIPRDIDELSKYCDDLIDRS
jgi:transcriptional regulator with XRE-family HTH domain